MLYHWATEKSDITSQFVWNFIRSASTSQHTVILQIFGVVLFSIFSVVKGFAEIKKTPKSEKRL